MKKYIIRYANGNECPEIKDKFNSCKEAGKALIDYICDHNEYLDVDDNDYLSPFDFVLDEVECKEVNEVITNFESARKVLGLKPNDYTLFEHLTKFIAQFISDINPKHLDALIALNKLFTIAQAWNKEDGFVPDFLDEDQYNGILHSYMISILRDTYIIARLMQLNMQLRAVVLDFALKHLIVPNSLVNNLKTFIIRFSCKQHGHFLYYTLLNKNSFRLL